MSGWTIQKTRRGIYIMDGGRTVARVMGGAGADLDALLIKQAPATQFLLREFIEVCTVGDESVGEFVGRLLPILKKANALMKEEA